MDTTLRQITYQTLAIGFADNREAWLNRLADRMRPLYATIGTPLPDRIKLSIGFCSTGKRSNRLAECWDSTASDGYFAIFVRPDIVMAPDLLALEVAAILGHELVHAAVGIQAKHGKLFAKAAKAIGLVGPMKSTIAGPAFIGAITPLLAAVGPLPHPPLHAGALSTRPKTQPSRWIKVKCEECGYQARTTRQWLDEKGAPLCPEHGEMTAEGYEREGALRQAA